MNQSNTATAEKQDVEIEVRGEVIEEQDVAQLPANYDSLAPIDWNQVKAMKDMVAPKSTDAEFKMFLAFAQAMNLNPITKDCWFIKTNQGPQIMCGINGYMKVANSHPMYDGMEVNFKHDSNGNLISCKCAVYRKDRSRPHIAEVFLKEYKKQSPIWRQMEHQMLAKCAKSVGIRESFILELGGTYTSDEMPPEFNVTPPKKQEPVKIDNSGATPLTYRFEGFVTKGEFDFRGQRIRDVYMRGEKKSEGVGAKMLAYAYEHEEATESDKEYIQLFNEELEREAAEKQREEEERQRKLDEEVEDIPF